MGEIITFGSGKDRQQETEPQGEVLITGASGLLGRALVTEFLQKKVPVFAQYRRNRPDTDNPLCAGLPADFSRPSGIQDFLLENSLRFKHCRYLVNNYGPITSKPFEELSGDDFVFDYFHNLVTAFEITNFFVRHTAVEAVVNLGFEGLGEKKAYKKIVTYAAAKNALKLLTLSFAEQYKNIRFHMVSPSTMTGAQVKAPKGKVVSPQSVAREIIGLLTSS